jgi:hypothetical protein
VSAALHVHAARWWQAAPGSAERAVITAAAMRLNWPPADWRAALAATAPAEARDG